MLESLLVLVLVGFSSAHICSIEPPQRGGFSIGQAGDPSCYRRVDCSSQPAGPVTRTYTAGSTVTLLVQQNLNHFSAFFGGYIDVALAPSPSNLTFTTLAWRNDFVGHEQVLQTNYSLQVTMPSTPSPHAVLRVRYVSNNPDEIDPPANVQAIFWQCADVAIVSGAPQQPPAASPLPQFPAAAIHRETAVLRAQSSSGCCAPTTFQMTGQEHNPTGTSSSYAVYWDAVNQRTRIDKNSTAGPPLTMWNLYGAQKEYVLNHITGKCELYGPDAFYSWCFGSFFSVKNFMSYSGTTSTPSGNAYVYSTLGGDKYAALANGCYPASVQLAGASTFTYANQGPLQSTAVFNVPQVCLDAVEVKYCNPHRRHMLK